MFSLDDDGPPLSNTDVKNLVILTELPFVVSFEERVKVKQILKTIQVQKVVAVLLFYVHSFKYCCMMVINKYI